MEMAEASDIIAVGVRAFGLEASEAGRVADVLGLTASKTNTTVQELGEGMKFVAPVAKQLGFSIEETSAMLGKLEDAGIKSTMGGTALRKMMLMLGPDIEKHGTKAFYDFMAVQQGVTTNFDKFGARAVTGAGVLQDMSSATAELTEELLGASGAVDEMARRQLDNLTGDITLLTSAVSGLQIAVGEQLDPTLRELAQSATLVVAGLQSAFEEFAKSNKATGEIDSIKDSVLALVSTIVETVSWIHAISDAVTWTFDMAKMAIWGTLFVIAHVVKKVIQIVGGALNWFGLMSDETLKGATNSIQSSINNIAGTMEDSAHNVGDKLKDAFGGGAFDKGDSFFAKIEEQFNGSGKLGEDSGKALGEGFSSGLDKALSATPQATDAQMAWFKSAEQLVESLEKEEQAMGRTKSQVLGLAMVEAELHSQLLYTATAMEFRINKMKKEQKEFEKLESASLSLIESLRTPQEVFDDEVANYQKMVDAKLITTTMMEDAIKKLRGASAEDIEINIITKGFVEGLQTAMGTVNVAGQVDRTEQIAEKTLNVQENMKSLTEVIKKSTEKTASVLNGTVDTKVDGLGEGVTKGIKNANVLSDFNSDKLEDLAQKSNDLQIKGFNLVVNELRRFETTTSSPLT